MITITIYKRFYIELTFLNWFIWPVWKRNWNLTYQAEQVEVGFKYKDDKYRDTGSHYVTRRALTDFYIWILFFKIHFPLWHTDQDVAMIYPANYNWKEDSLFDEKYQALANTGYFA